MDDVDTVKVKKDGFLNHVFNFDTETKSNMMNIIQYLVLAIIPMSFYTHFVNNMMSEYDESKSNFEVTAEVLGHLLLTLLGLFFIDRIITFVPTYSGRNHGTFNIFSVLLIILVFAYEANTKVGTKMKLLIERVSELWHGKKEDVKKQKENNSVVKVSQPISRGGMPTHQASRADYLNSHNAMVSPTQMLPPANEPQQESGGNNMYNSGGFNGLVNAQGPNMQNEPMAANDGISAFSGF
jgi:hypothetical protein